MAQSVAVDVVANRKAVKWTRREKLMRVLFAAVMPLFRLSPRPFWGLRRTLLRVFGAEIGADVHIAPSVRIMIPANLRIGARAAVGERAILYALGPISIGADATISQGAHLCAGTHDFRGGAMTLLKPPIRIGEGAWICAEAFVGPGVTIGEAAVVGARAVVTRDVAAGAVVAGNPARPVGTRERPGTTAEEAFQQTARRQK